MAAQADQPVHSPEVDKFVHPESTGGLGGARWGQGPGPGRRLRAAVDGQYTTTRAWGSTYITDPGDCPPPLPDQSSFPDLRRPGVVFGETVIYCPSLVSTDHPGSTGRFHLFEDTGSLRSATRKAYHHRPIFMRRART